MRARVHVNVRPSDMLVAGHWLDR